MLYLILAIASSATISLLMRLSTDRVKNNIAMLAMNYITCFLLAIGFTGIGNLFSSSPNLPQTIAMGMIHGTLYLGSFILLNISTQRNGVVLSSIFIKLGLLVPMVVSILLFGEMPSSVQWLGFAIAVAAMVIINTEPGQKKFSVNWLLILLLLGGGSGDAMSKIFEELGDPTLSDPFLLYTFLTALILCLGLMLLKKQKIGKPEFLFGALIGIPNFFSAKFLLQSLNYLPAVIVYPTFSVGTILVVTLAGVLFFKEILNRRQWFALGIILIALSLLNL